ncbi:MAG: DMT family transporter [Longimicrobiales bacterium]
MTTTTATPPTTGARGVGAGRAAGYLFALCAGATWGTTGPLSTLLYSEGSGLTDVGFWRILLAALGFAIFGLFSRQLFRIDRRGLLWIGLVGGLFVALFEVAFQYAIAGVGVAGAVALLYTAPVMVAIFAHRLLGEKLTVTRIALAMVVMVGVWFTVNGNAGGSGVSTTGATRIAGIVGGLLAAVSFGGGTLLARHIVPRYGSQRMLFYELIGGTLLLAMFLPLSGHVPQPPPTSAGWLYIAGLGIGSVLAANFFYFAAVKRIEAAPASIAASIEPFVGAALALLLFQQQLTTLGWFGLVLVVGGVSGGYLIESHDG